jgi:hypothetical protein
LNSKLKVPRPKHEKQQLGVIEVFKQYLPERVKGIISEIRESETKKRDIIYWCQDETRVGFRTESGRKITLKGVKPQQTFQWHYDYYYIYELIEPVGGHSCLGRIPLRLSAARGRLRFFYEFSHFNSDCMEIFLEKFAVENQEQIHIIQLDNAPIHTAKKLKVPENIILLFQPSYCEGLSPESHSGACKPRPEVNPIERVWEYIISLLRET